MNGAPSSPFDISFLMRTYSHLSFSHPAKIRTQTLSVYYRLDAWSYVQITSYLHCICIIISMLHAHVPEMIASPLDSVHVTSCHASMLWPVVCMC